MRSAHLSKNSLTYRILINFIYNMIDLYCKRSVFKLTKLLTVTDIFKISRYIDQRLL